MGEKLHTQQLREMGRKKRKGKRGGGGGEEREEEVIEWKIRKKDLNRGKKTTPNYTPHTKQQHEKTTTIDLQLGRPVPYSLNHCFCSPPLFWHGEFEFLFFFFFFNQGCCFQGQNFLGLLSLQGLAIHVKKNSFRSKIVGEVSEQTDTEMLKKVL